MDPEKIRELVTQIQNNLQGGEHSQITADLSELLDEAFSNLEEFLDILRFIENYDPE